jgi:iron(III) transport system permease protein
LPLLPIVVVGLTLLPVAVVAAALFSPSLEVWGHLWDTILPTLLANTFWLLMGVGLGTLLLGTGLAWLMTAYDFPGKGAFQWLLVLPMAVPAYIMGFIYVALFDFAGPVQGLLRSLGGQGIPFPQIRSGAGAILVMSLVLYPYVYLLAKAGFEEQAGSAFEAARALGCPRSRAFFKIALPLARPSIAAGVALASMEALADFATVRYFNFPTIADGILRVWHGMMDLGAASEMAGLLAMLALALLLAEQRLRGHRAYHQARGRLPGIPALRLAGWQGMAAAATCLTIVLAAFGLPALQLVHWAAQELGEMAPGALAVYGRLALNSLTLAGLAAGFAVLMALLTASLSRLSTSRLARYVTRLVTIGYAIPGAVIGVGILLPLSALDRSLNHLAGLWWGITPGLLFTGSLVGLLYAYTVRFMAVAYSSVDSSLDKITPNIVLAARALGAGPYRLIFRIKLPLILPGLVAGAILVFVDVMKELPITVLLRPLGYDTLAIWVWQMAAESLWTATALPALAIVLAGLLPIKLLLAVGKG